MKNNTGLIVLVVILSLLVGGLGVFFIYDKVLNIDDKVINNNENNVDSNTRETYSFSSVSGYYYTDIYDVNNIECTFAIYLLENGIFKIVFPAPASYGYIGNYIINNNVITLNYWFSYNSGAGKTFVNETKNIRITSLNTLEIDHEGYGTNGLETFTLEKDNNNANTYDFYNDLKNNFLDGSIFLLNN